MKKITIEEFIFLKQSIINLFEDYEKFIEQETQRSDINPEEVEKQVNEKFLRDFFSLQNELLDCDLSDIPFELWEGLTLYAEHLDFSKTKANIDFSLLKDIGYESINIDGCNIKGLERLSYDGKTFSKEFMQNHPEYFPADNIPEEVKERFYHKKLTFKDLKDYPDLMNCVNEYSFTGYYHENTSGELVSAIRYEYAMKMFNEYPEFVVYITTHEDSYSRIFFTEESNVNSYEDAKKMIFKQVINAIKKYYGVKMPSLDLIPEEMQKLFPDVFIEEKELPEEVIEDYYKGILNLNELRYYKDILKTKEINIGIKNEYGYNNLLKIFPNIWEFLDSVPKELDYVVYEYLAHIYDEQTLEELSQIKIEELITRAIKQALISYDRAINLDTLCAFADYLPIDEIISDEYIRNFINKCGFKNLVEFNKNNHFILDIGYSYNGNYERALLGYLSYMMINKYTDIEITNQEDLKKFIGKLINDLRMSDNAEHNKIVQKGKKELMAMYPSEFLDYEMLNLLLTDVPEETKKRIIDNLELGINGNINLLFGVISKHPDLITALNHSHIIIKSSDQHLKEVYLAIGQEKFLQIGSIYGEAIIKMIGLTNGEKLVELINNLRNIENFEDVLNQFCYERITNKRAYDIKDFPQSFKEKYPELYLKENAPEDLVKNFYGTCFWSNMEMKLIDLEDLHDHPEWIEYLLHVDLNKSLDAPTKITLRNLSPEKPVMNATLVEALSPRFTQVEILRFFANYGRILNSLSCSIDIGPEYSNMQIYEYLLESIYLFLSRRNLMYDDSMPQEFKDKYPDLFISTKDDELKNLFYQKKITPEMIQMHEEWTKDLNDKNLSAVCDQSILSFVKDCTHLGLDNEKIFSFFKKYGKYLVTCKVSIMSLDPSNMDLLEEAITKQIEESIINKRTPYNESAYPLIGERHPELFLDLNAPEELKNYFYNISGNNPLSFAILKNNKDWLPYLKDKNVLLSLQKQNVATVALEQFFNKYGEEALKIGMKNPESVMMMLSSNKLDVLSNWYDKLNFIPHHVVMMDFPFEQSDKFIASGKKWSNLMRLERYNLNEETKSALLKSSMCFGVFDNDNEGYNKIIQLFSGLPKTITPEDFSKVSTILNGRVVLVEDDVSQANDIFTQLNKQLNESYVQKEDGNYHLNFDVQEKKGWANTLRGIMEEANVSSILTPDKAHKIFGGFAMQYDPDFRDFILDNMSLILQSDEYIPFISSMQKQWREIKAVNSNRVLTLDLALAYVKSNEFQNVQIGNEKLAQISNIAGYSQSDFDVLQEIYNYGRMRVFNSIPAVRSTKDEYVGEVLRLDDPLALAIGTLTDCCQELGNAAETCVEHSMVSAHGRIFVVKDQEDNIVAQSWMWRNKNVICFDNIEIPSKAFSRVEKMGVTRKDFTDTIYELYKDAAEKLIDEDNKMYQSLLEEGKITQEQYDALTLAKVTVGTGYNDIAESLERNAALDKTDVTRPLEFTPPVNLNHGLYTNDSKSQYIIAGNEEVVTSKEEPIMIYSDNFIIYDDSNITKRDLVFLQKLEYITHSDLGYSKIDTDSKENVVSEIGDNYNLNPEATRIIMNANFAIVYEDTADKIILGDILYNSSITVSGQELNVLDNVKMQLSNALKQIIGSKELDKSKLTAQQCDFVDGLLDMEDKLNEERGIL